LRKRHVIYVIFNDFLEEFVEFRSIVHTVALEHNDFVDLDEVFWRDTLVTFLVPDEVENFVDVLSLDKRDCFFVVLLSSST
jgi:hypothetical protein